MTAVVPHYIDGARTTGASVRTGDVFQPATGSVARSSSTPPTGVLGRYDHANAAFLAGQGFMVLTDDHRGSAPRVGRT